MKKTWTWQIVFSTHGADITLLPGLSDAVATMQYVRDVFVNGIWVSKTYFPPAHLISASITLVEAE